MDKIDQKIRWEIGDGFYLEPVGSECIKLVDLPDGVSITIEAIEINDFIDALKRAKSHFRAEELAAAERDRLARWGVAKTPAEAE